MRSELEAVAPVEAAPRGKNPSHLAKSRSKANQDEWMGLKLSRVVFKGLLGLL